MNNASNKSIDLTSFPKKSFWSLAIPLAGFVFFNAIYGVIDLYWLSKLNPQSFYAASASIPIFTLICAIGSSIGQGANSLMSRSIGADDYDNAYNTLVHGILICLAIWIIIILFIPSIDNILNLTRLNNSIDLVITYLTPIFFCSICFMLPNFFSETMQSEGDSKRPTIIIIFSNILNLILDPIFIFSLNLGLLGAAYATIMSSLICTIILLYFYLGKKTKIPLQLKFFKLNSSIVVEILTVSIPNFFKDSLFCFMGLFVNGILLHEVGEIGVKIFSASIKLEELLISPIRAYGRGLMSVTGQLFGSKKINELKEIYWYVLKISLITIIFVSILFVVFRDILYYSLSIWDMEIAVGYIAIFGSIILASDAIILITSKMIDGFGKSYYNLLFTVLLIFLQFVLISINRVILHNGSSVLIGIVLAQIIAAIMFYAFLRYLFKKFEKQHKEGKLIVFKKKKLNESFNA